MVTQAIKMCLSITLAVVAITGFASIPFLIVLALCIGTVNAVDMPVRQSFAVEMVGREDIGNAVALNSAMFNSARVIGPAVAGLVDRGGRRGRGLRRSTRSASWPSSPRCWRCASASSIRPPGSRDPSRSARS